ncbi:hypothetical protein MY10362_007365 [Beauveria mimosiformis]
MQRSRRSAVTSAISFSDAEARMVAEFIEAGHTSLAEQTPDGLHPLHRLFLDTQGLLKEHCRSHPHVWGEVPCTLEAYRDVLCGKLLKLKYSSEKAKDEDFNVLSQKNSPSHAELLALRFATPEESDNVKIVELLTTLNILHLWHVPPHTDTEARMPEMNDDDAGDSITVYAPTEDDSNLETGRNPRLTNIDRKLKAIQDARRDLEHKLAVVRKAETAVLQAQCSMVQADNAMEMAESALLQSPMSFLIDNF